MPSDPGVRERLGPYADLILGDNGLVTHGSVEHMAYLEACIESAGFDVKLDDGGLAVNFGSQRAFFENVNAACSKAAETSGLVAPQNFTDERFLSAQYDAFMLTYDCMVREGYPVAAPPSKDTYIEAGGMNWHPYNRLAGDASATESECPQDLVILFQMLASGTAP